MKRHLIFFLLALAPCAALAQDTLIVRVDNPPLWGTNPTLVEELRIGVLEGDARYQFGSIVDVIEAANGDVWVADWTLGAIRRYSSTGVHLGDVGRKGQGPGEFTYIDGMRALPDGRIAVLDTDNGRVSLFDESGFLTGDFRSPVIGLHGGQQSFQVDTDGRLYLWDLDRSTFGPNLVRYSIRLSSDGEVVDTVDAPSISRKDMTTTGSLISPLGYLVQGRTDAYDVVRRMGYTMRG